MQFLAPENPPGCATADVVLTNYRQRMGQRRDP